MTLTRSAEITPQEPERTADGHRFLGAAPVPWRTVVLLAVLLAFGNGFVVTTVGVTVGAIGRTDAPFLAWLATSALTLPVFLLAVLGGLAVARRWLGPVLVRPLRVLAAAVIIAAAASLVGTAEVAVSGAYNYHLQSEQLQSNAAVHARLHHSAGASCLTCTAQRDTLAADIRAARIAGRVIVLVDVVIVLWVAAVAGGRLDGGRRRRPA
jgi:hypothetical protein